MINEFQNSYNLKGKNKIILAKNLNYVYEVIEKNKDNSFEKIMEKTHKEKKKGHNSYKFDWIIEFYFDEEIKSDCDKNIFIALSCWGDILIFSIYLFKNSINNKLNSNEGKKRPYEIIKIEKIDIFKPTRITKLKKLFKPKKNNNFFIINSRNSSKWGQAVIINVIENPDVDLKKRYNITIIQKIDDINGLFSSIEFYYKENTYLLNFYNNFYLWEYNSEINQIEKHIIENNVINNDQIFNYGPLMFEENKKLFIIQCFSPYFIIEFYNLAEKNDEFSFQKIDKVIEFENEDNMPLKKINNYCFYKSRYLLLSSCINKNKSKGGIFIIDLEQFEIIAFQRFPKYTSINCIIPTKNDNIIIGSSVFNFKKYRNKAIDKNKQNEININRGRLLLLEIIETNNDIYLDIKKYSEGGTFYYINCGKLFFETYFFSSIYKSNCLIKLNENGKFTQYCQINK